ncbi:MAG: hypothetical protein U1F43_00955 [Myxococcota bacterium]
MRATPTHPPPSSRGSGRPVTARTRRPTGPPRRRCVEVAELEAALESQIRAERIARIARDIALDRYLVDPVLVVLSMVEHNGQAE